MLEFASRTLDFAGHTFTYGELGLAGVAIAGALAVGACIPVLITKICSVAKAAFARISEYLSKVPLIVRIKSMFCDDCAMRHREHVVRRREANRREEIGIVPPREPIIQPNEPIIQPNVHEEPILPPIPQQEGPDIGVDE